MLVTDEEMWIIPVTTETGQTEYLITMDSSRESARERALNWIKTQPNLVDLGEPKIPFHVL